MKIARSADANTIRNRPEYLPAHRCIVRLSASGASSAAISRGASEAESTSRFTPNGGAVATSTGVLPAGLVVGAIFVVSAMAFGLPLLTSCWAPEQSHLTTPVGWILLRA